MTLLTAQSLTVTARIGGETLPVIRNLDFALATGKILGLVGESGAGRSMVGGGIVQLLYNLYYSRRFRTIVPEYSLPESSLMKLDQGTLKQYRCLPNKESREPWGRPLGGC